jgi:hypothetical protein
MVEKIMSRPLKKPQVPEKELEVQFFIPDHAGTPLFLADAKGEILWEALPDDWKAAKKVELVKLLVFDSKACTLRRELGHAAETLDDG